MNFNLNAENFSKELRRRGIYDLINKLAVSYYEMTGKAPNRLVCHHTGKSRLWREEVTTWKQEGADMVLYIATAVGELEVVSRDELQPGAMYVEKVEESGDWIPGDATNQRCGWYLVTVEDSDGGRRVFEAWYNAFAPNHWYHRETAARGSEIEGKVVAHMPLPKAYEGGTG